MVRELGRPELRQRVATTVPVKYPTIRKESRPFCVSMSHDLKGVTTHPDAMAGEHRHLWFVTLIWVAEFNCKIGFQRDEHTIEEGWRKRILELDGKNLSELMKLPATAENFACWLLFYWLPRLSEYEINFELTGVRVNKGNYTVELMHTTANKRGWKWFGGEVV